MFSIYSPSIKPLLFNYQAQMETNYSSYLEPIDPIKQDQLKVLIWTSYFGKRWLDFRQEVLCPKSNCVLSDNRKDSNIFDAIVFH